MTWNERLIPLTSARPENLVWVNRGEMDRGGSWHLYQWGLPYPANSWTNEGEPTSYPVCVPLCGADPFRRVGHDSWITYGNPLSRYGVQTWQDDDFCAACIYEIVTKFPEIFDRRSQ